VDAKVTQNGDESVIAADLPPARPDDNVKLAATLIDGSGKSSQVPLVQTAPGHFEAPTFLDQPGAYFVRVESTTPVTNSSTVTEVSKIERTLTWVKPYSAEYMPSDASSGIDAMDAWAALGGGARLTSPAQAFELNAPVAASRTELFPWLMALAALLLPLDIGVRRIAVSFRKLMGFGRHELATATLERGGRMSQLMQAKMRSTQLQDAERVSLFDRGGAATHLRQRPQGLRPRPGETAASAVSETEETEPETPTQASATASELLRRRRKGSADTSTSTETDDKPGEKPEG
jgi:hypothetical protein